MSQVQHPEDVQNIRERVSRVHAVREWHHVRSEIQLFLQVLRNPSFHDVIVRGVFRL